MPFILYIRRLMFSYFTQKINVKGKQPLKAIQMEDGSIFNAFTDPIGKGPNSEVYYAEDPNKAPLAIKFYSIEWIANNEHIKDIETEAYKSFGELGISPKLLAKPFQSSHYVYVPIEHCNFGSLLEQQKIHFISMTKNPLKEFSYLFAESLATLHSKNVLHKQIKPSHILVHCDNSGKYSVKFCGWKSCQKKEELASVTPCSNLSPYDAPELSSTAIDLSADIWSLGIVLYELVFGQVPQAIYENFLDDLSQTKILRHPQSDVDPNLLDLITRCLKIDPSERLSASEILKHPYYAESSQEDTKESPNKEVKSDYYVEAPPEKPKVSTEKEIEPHHMVESPTKKNNEWTLEDIKKDMFSYFSQRIKEEGKEKLIKAVKLEEVDPKLKIGKRMNRPTVNEKYKCEKDGIPYVLKIIKTSEIVNQKQIDYMFTELENMIALQKSAFSIDLIEYYFCNNNLHILMEYCNGGNLGSYIKSKGTLPIEDIGLICLSLASGLRDMHALKIVHRNINTDNILMVIDPATKELKDVKITDYGFSKMIKEANPSYTVLGTPGYMAPELSDISLGLPSEKIDVYSFGSILHFILQGKPYNRKAKASINEISKELSQLEINQDFLTELKRIMIKCIEDNPEKRPSFEQILTCPFFRTIFIGLRKSISPYVFGRKISSRTGCSTMVFECTKGSLKFALKLINVVTKSSPSELEKVFKEIKILTELKELPHIVKVYNYFVVNNILYMVSDLFNGGDLEKYTLSRKQLKAPFSVEEQEYIAYCVLSTLSYMHQKNILHRDIHKKNILIVTDQSNPKIIKNAVISEFGIEGLIETQAETSKRLGAYLAPEVVSQDKYTKSSDIWSFGMLLHYILFGCEATVPKTGTVKITAKPGVVVSEPLFTLMNLCLDKNPSNRKTAEGIMSSMAIFKNPKFN